MRAVVKKELNLLHSLIRTISSCTLQTERVAVDDFVAASIFILIASWWPVFVFNFYDWHTTLAAGFGPPDFIFILFHKLTIRDFPKNCWPPAAFAMRLKSLKKKEKEEEDNVMWLVFVQHPLRVEATAWSWSWSCKWESFLGPSQSVSKWVDFECVHFSRLLLLSTERAAPLQSVQWHKQQRAEACHKSKSCTWFCNKNCESARTAARLTVVRTSKISPGNWAKVLWKLLLPAKETPQQQQQQQPSRYFSHISARWYACRAAIGNRIAMDFLHQSKWLELPRNGQKARVSWPVPSASLR